ncbi:MAG TPA: trypsin-like peptidase domain-containing protein [Negativicutes bacterium]|nr:trypsin-like peptidase domain-containing protein [Negativicutes bacterium]
MYKLDPINRKKVNWGFKKLLKNHALLALLFATALLVVMGFFMQTISFSGIFDALELVAEKIQKMALQTEVANQPTEYVPRLLYEEAIIETVASASPSVVSIVISKNLPVYELEFIGIKYQEVGSGSGFIVSEDGLIVTNKHVVSDKKADYTVFTQDGKKYAAKVVALDPVQDLAIIKVESDVKFPAITLGDSNGIKIGQGAIAIGNALGEFSNTVSVGVVSGLGRTVSASSQTGSFSETLENIIQTDAAINAGNSGGPLLNLRGEVIGVNTAMAQGAQSIGFAIPINIAKKDINQILANNKITYAFLGVRYVLVDEAIKEKYGLAVEYGALVIKGDNGEAAITKGSAAEKAGIKEKDVILELNGRRVSKANSMASMIQQHSPGDTVTVKILRSGEEMNIEVVLGERN